MSPQGLTDQEAHLCWIRAHQRGFMPSPACVPGTFVVRPCLSSEALLKRKGLGSLLRGRPLF